MSDRIRFLSSSERTPARMNGVITSVCRLVPSGSKITDDYERIHYWDTMLQYWKLPGHIKHFPGANPMSIEEKDFAKLGTDDFLAALKTDGVRHLLLLTTKPKSTDPIAIMIDRAKKMYEVEIWANEDFFEKGSLYDGELVWENDMMAYVVFDVIFTKGVQVSRLPYRERMQIVHNTILCVSNSHSDESIETMIAEESKFLARHNIHNLRVVPKKCVPKANLRTLWRERTTSNHRNDGIIFTLNSAPVETGTSPSILKWKPSHSIDVLFCRNDDELAIYGNTNNSGELFDITNSIDDLTTELVKSVLLDAVNERLPCILECVIHVKDNTVILKPERERTDKIAPNTINTIKATIRNAKENISSDSLIRLVNSL